MKTAIELADEFPEQNIANIEPDAVNILNGWGIEAVAMLLQQAEQIDQLGRWKSTHAPRIEALEGLLATTQRQVSTSREAAQTLESERQANAMLTAENESLRIERDALIALSEQVAKERDALKALVDNPRNTPFGKEAEKLADDWLAANAPGGWIDDLRNKCEALEITNDALKADAERYRWWVTQVEHKDFENLEKAFKSMEAREDVTKQMMDAAIDAMKGKS